MEIEKRKHKRFNTDYHAEILVFKELKIRALVRILDLSSSGARIETNYEILKDEEIKLILNLDENITFNLAGKIVWSKRATESGLLNYGIQFKEFGIFHKSSWERFIKSKIEFNEKNQIDERRKFKRFKIDTSVIYIKKSAVTDKQKGYVTDISMNGMNLYSVEDIPEQENVVIEFPYMENIFFNIIGKIVRKNKLSEYTNYGILLDVDSEEQKSHLKNYVLLRIK